MSGLPVSPLAPTRFPDLPAVAGVRMGAVAAGLRYKGRPDLLMVEFAENTAAAGVFTKSKMPAAPVEWSRSALRIANGRARALVVNAGNANAFTGNRGRSATEKTAKIASGVVGCLPEEVLIASTGVIGEPLNVSSFNKFLPRIYDGLSGTMWRDAAKAITTTDTFIKGAGTITYIEGRSVAISGIAKGSGMIQPDMATMLGFLFTDAPLTPACLQAILSECAEKSFNCVTVDGDTSTNDTVFAFATGGDLISDPADPRLEAFKEAFLRVMTDLAKQLARDGEGASKFVTINLEGAQSDTAAKNIALTVANSPLVKTAIAGEDPNWGRLVMAVGKSGEEASRDKLAIWIGEQQVAKDSVVCSGYSEQEAAAYMKGQDIDIRIHVGIGKGTATVWTCDLTQGYININADYRS